MKNKIICLLLFIQCGYFPQAQYQTTLNEKSSGTFINPIFAGDYPDPSILRDGDTYYLVNSSFDYYPGLLIWQSKDLINWNPVTNALYKNIGSVWAPDLVKCNNKFYIYFPANNKIYVVYADAINGPWSDPVDLNINNIDPGHFTDTNGKRYLYFANGSYVALSDDGLSVIGEAKHAYAGWKIPRDWSIECFCLEGPKIAKRGEYYYLTVAEGGTAGPATSHMIISARSKSPFGPWENSPYNPIDKTYNSNERWWSKGHATLFDDTKGRWWIVFHAYEKGHYNMGRQTLLEPVEWTKDGWFKIPTGIKADKPIQKPYATSIKSIFSLSDNFKEKVLQPQWKFFGEYDTTRFSLNNNALTIKAKGKNIGESSPLLCVPSHHSYTAEVEVEMQGNAIGGLALFYNKDFSSGILADSANLLTNLHGWQFIAEKNAFKKHVFLRLKNVENTVDLFFSTDGVHWNKSETSFEVSGMNNNVLGGFLSLRISLCSIGEGSVTFKNFKYQPIK
ncbi:MAG: family 43 glycosylhydrolase [Ferruginibacter sp.]